MSILFVGSEPGSFDCSGNNTSTYRRSAFCRVGTEATATVAIVAGFTGQTSLWLSTYFQQNTGITASVVFVGLTSGAITAGNIKIGVRTTSTVPTTLSIIKYDGVTTTVLCTSTLTITGATLYKLDLQVVNFSDSGTVRLYIDNVLFCEYTGDITADSSTELNGIFLRNAHTSYAISYSEVIVATDDTRLMSVKTLAPDSAGDTNNWSGAYTDIDDTAIADTDFIYSDAADEVFTCNLTGMPTGTFDVKCVVVDVRAADGVGGTDLKVGVKTNSTESYGSPQTLTGGWASYKEYFYTNPVTSNPFTPAEIDALQLALKTAATP